LNRTRLAAAYRHLHPQQQVPVLLHKGKQLSVKIVIALRRDDLGQAPQQVFCLLAA